MADARMQVGTRSNKGAAERRADVEWGGSRGHRVAAQPPVSSIQWTLSAHFLAEPGREGSRPGTGNALPRRRARCVVLRPRRSSAPCRMAAASLREFFRRRCRARRSACGAGRWSSPAMPATRRRHRRSRAAALGTPELHDRVIKFVISEQPLARPLGVKLVQGVVKLAAGDLEPEVFAGHGLEGVGFVEDRNVVVGQEARPPRCAGRGRS